MYSLGQAESRGAYDSCVALMQARLVDQGRLSPQFRTGYLNMETVDALNAQFGRSWTTFPGGLCALYASLSVTNYGGGSVYPYSPPQQSFFENPTNLLLIGGGILALVLLMRK